MLLKTKDELENCVQSKLDRLKHSIGERNVVVYEMPFNGEAGGSPNTNKDSANAQLKSVQNLDNEDQSKPDLTLNPSPDLLSIDESQSSQHGEKYFLPYTGNGYIGLSVLSKKGLFASMSVSGHQIASYSSSSLNLSLMYSPLAFIYADNLNRKEAAYIELKQGLVHKLQCYQIVIILFHFLVFYLLQKILF